MGRSFSMKSYNGPKVNGHDYSKPLKETIQEAMGNRGWTVNQIAKRAGRSRETVSRIINVLHKEKVVYIVRWKRNKSGPITAAYRVGILPDEPKPAAYTDAEKCARWRNTEHGKKKQRELKSSYTERQNAKRYAGKVLAGIDPLLAGIMGYKRSTRARPIEQNIDPQLIRKNLCLEAEEVEELL